MNLFGLSPGELLLILMVAMVVLGPEKIPEVAASLGKWIREFRRATEELTAQFAGENPLYELQRALSLTDEPAAAPPAPAVDPASAPALPQLSPATEAVATTPPTSLAEPPRSTYFLYPPTSPGIADDWVHGSLADEVASRNRASPALLDPLDDDWTHGVPMTVPLARAGTSVDSNGHVASPGDEVSASGEGASEADRDHSYQLTTPAVDEDEVVARTADGPVGAPRAAGERTEPEDTRDGVRLGTDPSASGSRAEVVAVGEPSANGVTAHPADLVAAAPAPAGEGRQGDRT